MLAIIYIALIVWASITAISFIAFVALYIYHLWMERRRGLVALSDSLVDRPEGATPA